MRSQEEYVLRTVEERGIRFVQLWFTDVLGTPKTFSITPAELENALEEGMTFDGSAIDGFSRVQESDVLARPDAKTFQLLPWHGHSHGAGSEAPVARVFCDISDLDGTPFQGCPRHVLRRTLQSAVDRGFTFYAAPEIEYFYFADGDPAHPPQTLDAGSYFELTGADQTSDIRQRTVLTLEEMGIPVEHAQHEDAPSQHEIDLRYTDALTMADTVMSVRLVVKEMARQQGVHASFMPKPLSGVQGSGMHTHLSLNSYKRLVTGYEAPIHVSWARNNRSALIRVPVTKDGKPESTRIEYRAPDSACNPYLAFAVILAAGLRGIDQRYELPDETGANLFDLSPDELTASGIAHLPGSLNEALVRMETSELLFDTLGEHVFEWFLRNKRVEWADYKAHVSQFELDRYLPLL